MDRFAAPANLAPPAAAPAEPQCRDVPVPLRSRHVPFIVERALSAVVATRYVCDLRRVSEADPSHIRDLCRGGGVPDRADRERCAVSGRSE